MPADHACPECGLRFDARCELYRAANARQILFLWIAIFGGGWIVLRNLAYLGKFATATWWQKIGPCDSSTTRSIRSWPTTFEMSYAISPNIR